MALPRTRTVAVIEVLGGTWAVVGGLYTWMTVGMSRDWACVGLVGGGALSAWAGVLLWRGAAGGIRLSQVVQAAQLFQVVIPGAAFVAVLAPSLTLGIFDGAIGFRAAIEEEAVLFFGSHHGALRLELNLLAVVLLVALRRVGRGAAVDASKSPSSVAAF
jgi:hypothetical protein